MPKTNTQVLAAFAASLLWSVAHAAVSPASLPKALQVSDEVPGKSMVRSLAAVRKDVLKSLKKHEQSAHKCKTYTVVDTANSSDGGDLLFDGRGRLFRGMVTDNWTVDACGVRQELVIVIQADGKGGHGIVISKKDK